MGKKGGEVQREERKADRQAIENPNVHTTSLYGTPKNEESERCCLGSSMDICSHKAKTAYYSGLGLLCDLGECQIL